MSHQPKTSQNLILEGMKKLREQQRTMMPIVVMPAVKRALVLNNHPIPEHLVVAKPLTGRLVARRYLLRYS